MAIPVFDIDLDEDPALRWRAVAAAGAHLIRRATGGFCDCVGLRWDLSGNSSQFLQVLVAVLPIWNILALSWSNRTEGTVRGDKNRAQAYAPHLRKLAEAWLLVLSPALGGGAGGGLLSGVMGAQKGAIARKTLTLGWSAMSNGGHRFKATPSFYTLTHRQTKKKANSSTWTRQTTKSNTQTNSTWTWFETKNSSFF